MPAADLEPPFTGHRLGAPGFRRIRVSLFLAGLATFAQLYGIQPLMPTFSAEFALTPAQSALSMSYAAIGLGVAMLAMGPISESLGRTPLMHASLLASAVVALACGFAPTWPVFLALRAAQGLALAGLPAVALAYLSEEVHRDTMARAAGIYIAGTALGGMSGRFIAGGLAELFGWRGAIVGLGCLGLVCAIAVRLLLPPSRGFAATPFRLRRIAASARALGRDRAIVSLFAIGCASMGVFVGLFNAAVFRLTSAPYSLSVGAVSLIFLIHLIGSASSAYAGRAADAHGFRAVAPVAAAVMALGVLITLATPLPVVILGMAVVSAGFFGTHGVASAWVVARATYGGGAAGSASAGYLFWYYLGSSVFGALTGAAWTQGRWPLVVAVCGSLAAVALALALRLRRIPSLLETAHPDPGLVGY